MSILSLEFGVKSNIGQNQPWRSTVTFRQIVRLDFRIKSNQMESDQIAYIKILEIKMPPLGFALDSSHVKTGGTRQAKAKSLWSDFWSETREATSTDKFANYNSLLCIALVNLLQGRLTDCPNQSVRGCVIVSTVAPPVFRSIFTLVPSKSPN